VEAVRSPRESLAYVAAVAAGARTPDYLATVDLDPTSKTYSRVVRRLRMPHVEDELHHFGWNACASCYCERARRFLVIPGLASGRIHVVDTVDPLRPMLHKAIESAEVIAKARLTGPHTVHCLSDGRIMVSMLGDERGDAPEVSASWTSGSRSPGDGRRAARGCVSTTTSGTSRGTT
jgi:selenium-binding protein 1